MHRFSPCRGRATLVTALTTGLLAWAGYMPVYAQAAYLVEDLGALDNVPNFGFQVAPMGINNNGQISGYVLRYADSRFHNFVWADGVMKDIGALAGNDLPATSNYSSRLYNVTGGINDAGQSTGIFYSDADNTFAAYLYNPSGNLIDFGVGDEGQFPNDSGIPGIGYSHGQGTFGCGISNSGEVVGWQATIPPVGLYYDGTTIHNLDFLIGQLPTIRTVNATAINSNHQIVGQYVHYHRTAEGFLLQDYIHAYRYTLGGGFVDLGTLQSDPGATSLATAINAGGMVVGTSSDRPFLYTNAGIQALDTIVRSGVVDTIGFPRSINVQGDVVGYSVQNLQSIGARAVLWKGTNHALLDLNNMIDPHSGWTLNDGTGINDKGQITGSGTRDGLPGRRGYRLTPIASEDVTANVQITRGGFRFNRATNHYVQTVTLTNKAAYPLYGAISLALDNLTPGVSLVNTNGQTQLLIPAGSPYAIVTSSALPPGGSATVSLEFNNPANAGITYATRVQSGAGQR